MATLTTAGAGTGGISEIASCVDPETITFGLCRVPVGGGAFKRDKFVFLHCNLETCSGLKRARINTKKGDVKKQLGEVHAELQFSTIDEIALDHVMEQLSSAFVGVDSGDASGMSVSKLKEEYEAMLRKVGAKKGEADKPAASVALTRKTAIEMGSIKGVDVLNSIKEQMGPFNWVLFRPTADATGLDLLNAGSLSVVELAKWLKDDEVACGLVRLGFGVGRFRRVKWVSLTWSGHACGAVKRAKAMSSRAAMKAKMGPVSVDLEVADRADITLAAVIDKVKRAAVLDGDAVETDSEAFSLEKFMEALTEEARANAEYFGDSGLVLDESSPAESEASPWGARPAASVIAEMRRPGSELNWAMFNVAQ